MPEESSKTASNEAVFCFKILRVAQDDTYFATGPFVTLLHLSVFAQCPSTNTLSQLPSGSWPSMHNRSLPIIKST